MTPRTAAGPKRKPTARSTAKLPTRKRAAPRGKAAAAKAGSGANAHTAPAASHAHPPLAYRLHALLHTMNSIARLDDSLCTLLTEIEHTGSVTAMVRRELTALLDELPGRVYLQDLEAVREALAPARAQRRTT